MEQEKLSQLDEYESDKTINQKEAWTRDKEEEPPSIAQTFNMDKIEIEKVKGIKTEEINIYDSPILACLSGNTTIHVVLDCGAEHNLITQRSTEPGAKHPEDPAYNSSGGWQIIPEGGRRDIHNFLQRKNSP